MNKNLIKAIEKVLVNQELSEKFFKLESLEDAYRFLQNFGSGFSIEEFEYTIGEISKNLTSEELKYIVDEMNNVDTDENLKQLVYEASRSSSPKELVCVIDDIIEEMTDSKLEDNELLSVAGGNKLIDPVKRITSTGLAAVTLLTGGVPVGASSLGDYSKQIFNADNYDKLSKEAQVVWQKAKKELGDCWKKTPKSVKVFGGIALASMPVLIGGRIVYVKTLKPNVDVIIGALKISYKRKYSPSSTKFEEMLRALMLHLPSFLTLGKSYDDCMAYLDLLKLASNENELRNKINSLSKDTLFSLSQMFQLEVQLDESSIKTFKNALEGQRGISQSDIDDLDLLVSKMEEFSNKTLPEYIKDVLSPMVNNRLQELNQKVLEKRGLTIKAHLGSGQSGEVYKCVDAENNEVVVKIMPKSGGPVSKASIKNESSVWKTVKDAESENLVKYKDHFGGRGVECFSMEYVDGSKDLTKVEPKDRNQVIIWAKEIFEGLKELHEKNIVHRDIKLENILLTNDDHIKICDFGLAKRAELTRTVCGTPGMMPPEVYECFSKSQKTPNKYDGEKFDVYSAAATIYCLLFNTTPKELQDKIVYLYDGSYFIDNFSISIEKYLKQDREDRFGNSIGDELVAFFKKCLAKNPGDRATIEEALELLENVK